MTMDQYPEIRYDGLSYSGPVHCRGCHRYLGKLHSLTGVAYEAPPCRTTRCRDQKIVNIVPLNQQRIGGEMPTSLSSDSSH